jgi:hypothetical protein
MKKISIMKAYHMKRALLVLAVLACIGSIASAQTYRPLTGTSVVLSTSYPSGNALTLQASPTAAYTLTLPAAAPTAGYILRSNPASANTLIWTSPLDMYDFQNGLTESGTSTVKWGGDLTGATTINTAGANAITFYNNTAATSATLTIGGGAGTLAFDVQGGTTINTTGSANTSIGNANGTLTLTSSTGLNVTSLGLISDGDGNLVLGDNVEPSVNDNFSLGTNTARWSDVFVGPSTVHIGSTATGGDELALSYNTTSNTAIFNVGSTNAMELTSTALTLAANLAANGDVTLGDAATDVLTVGATIAGQYPLYFEGATADAFETRFEITDPTADRTITFPNVDGTVITTGNTSDLATLAWLVGGNTITGGSTTRKIGLATQAANDDGLAIMTDGTDRLTITAVGASTFSGTLTSTGDFAVGASTFSVTAASGNTSVGGTLGVTGVTSLNGAATIGNGDDNVNINAGTGTFQVASTGVDISTAGAVSSVTTLNMSSTLTNTATSNQIVLGTTNTTTISATAPAASRVYTIPDVLANASFVLTAGAQTIGGAKTFSSDLAISSNTASTSTTTGALVVTGGVGVGGAVNVGGAFDVAGATTLDGDVTLGDAGADAITVNSTSGLVVNSGPDTDLAIDESQVARANSLTIQGANVTTPANVSSVVLAENMTLNSNAGGIALTATTAFTTRGATNTMRGYASETEYSEVDMTSTAIVLRAENGNSDPTLTVVQSLGTGIVTVESDNLYLESSNISIGNAATDIATFSATIAEQYPLIFEGATANNFETTFEITDPTADRTITFPDVTGTVITTGNTSLCCRL